MADIGHNSQNAADDEAAKSVETIAAAQLRSIIERIERLQEEKKTIQDDIRDVKAEAKGVGFDVSTINEMLKLRAMDKAERDEREGLRDTYGHALGIFG